MPWAAVPCVVAALVCWVAAVVSWVLALRHLSGRTSVLAMLFRGYEMLNGDNFTEAGRAHQRRFLLCFAGFFVSILVTGLVSAAAGR